jgi:hypothetical protein
LLFPFFLNRPPVVLVALDLLIQLDRIAPTGNGYLQC